MSAARTSPIESAEAPFCRARSHAQATEATLSSISRRRAGDSRREGKGRSGIERRARRRVCANPRSPVTAALVRALAVLAPFVVVGCASFSSDAPAVQAEDAGSDGSVPIVAPLGCDLTKSPKDSTACVDDSVGVFVSPSGDDGATGKKLAPVKSISKGIERAASRGLPRVYVCEGTYAESVEIAKAASLFGGLACDWKTPGTSPKCGGVVDFAVAAAVARFVPHPRARTRCPTIAMKLRGV